MTPWDWTVLVYRVSVISARPPKINDYGSRDDGWIRHGLTLQQCKSFRPQWSPDNSVWFGNIKTGHSITCQKLLSFNNTVRNLFNKQMKWNMGPQRLLDTFFPSLEFKNMVFFYIHRVCKKLFFNKKIIAIN